MKRLRANDSAGSRVKVGHRQAPNASPLHPPDTPHKGVTGGFCVGGRISAVTVPVSTGFKLSLLTEDSKIIQPMILQDVLYTQGFGTRRVCGGLIQQGFVELRSTSQWEVCADTQQNLEFDNKPCLRVQGAEWPFVDKAYIVLHKPEGTECSQKPSRYPSVYTLLPAPLRTRPARGVIQGVQAVGRLDQDTTGLLLLSDDGQFIHRMSSPKKQVSKVYSVTTKHAVSNEQVQKLLAGVVLDDDPKPVRAAACQLIDERTLDLTLTEGKYHQVKRMLAAVSNRVEALHRRSVGKYELPDDLSPGQWRWLSPEDLIALQSSET